MLEISGRIRRFDWIAISIDRRIVLSDVLVVGSWKETKDSLSCQRSQYSTDGCLFDHVTLFIHQGEEKCLVLDDGPAKAHPKLVAVL